MKKLILVGIIMTTLLAACVKSQTNEIVNKVTNSTEYTTNYSELNRVDDYKRFIYVYNEYDSESSRWSTIMVDTETGVMYLISENDRNAIGITIMLDPAGYPLLW